MTMGTASRDSMSEGGNHAAINMEQATKLSGGTTGCWRAKAAGDRKSVGEGKRVRLGGGPII